MWKVNFNLNRLSKLEANAEINGMKVSISQESQQLVVELAGDYDENDAHKKALEVANQFLNALCWKYNSTYEIDINSRSLENIKSEGSKQVYLYVHDTVKMSSHLTLVKKDSSGNVLEVYDSSKLGKMVVKPSEAASYYRHAHLTNDPFDKFHSLYLVAENIASKIQRAKGVSKNTVKQLSESGKSYEEGLLRLALDEYFSNNTHGLKQTAKNLAEFDESQTTIPQVANILYKGFRCQLSHAKALEDKKIPFNREDVKEVKTALPLMELLASTLLQYEVDFLLLE